jgi:hypothetical protein
MKRKRDKRSQPANDAQREARRNNMIAFNKERGGKPALKHGAQSAEVRAGIVPDAELQRLIDEFHAGWISDLGGAENLTSARKAILFAAKGSLACFGMAMRYLEKNGLVDERGKVAPVAGILATFGNSLRLHLTAAGLDRKARDCKTLEMRLQEIADAEHAGSDTEAVSDSENGGPNET